MPNYIYNLDLPMEPDLKKQWVEALRSGKYTQGTRRLRKLDENGNSFCCLGVLLDISKMGQWDENEPADTNEFAWTINYIVPTDSECYDIQMAACLHHKVAEDLGVTDDDCDILMSLNDGMDTSEKFGGKRTFAELADIIEAGYIEVQDPNQDRP